MEEKIIYQNQRQRVNHLVFIALFIFVVGLGLWLIFANYHYFLKGGKSLSPALTCKYNDPPICAFINELKNIQNMAIKSTLTISSGEKTTDLFESQGGSKTHFISYDKSGQEILNWIFIDNSAYTKDYTDNRWWKQTADRTIQEEITAGINRESDFSQKASSPDDKTTYRNLGIEACGTLSCFKYQVIDPVNPDLKGYIYFDNDEYRLRKLVYEMKDGSSIESIYQYGQVEIAEPSSIKEAAADQNIFMVPGSPFYEEVVQRAYEEIIKKMLEQLQDNPKW